MLRHSPFEVLKREANTHWTAPPLAPACAGSPASAHTTSTWWSSWEHQDWQESSWIWLELADNSRDNPWEQPQETSGSANRSWYWSWTNQGDQDPKPDHWSSWSDRSG